MQIKQKKHNQTGWVGCRSSDLASNVDGMSHCSKKNADFHLVSLKHHISLLHIYSCSPVAH